MGFGEFFLSSKKGIGINIANLKDNIKREDYSGNSKLQAIFDMFDLDDKKDGILSASNKQGKNEIQSIFEKLGKADTNTDGVIDDIEAKKFLQKFLPNSNITSSELFTFLTSLIDTDKIKPNENSQTSTKKPMTEAEVQSGVIESLRADTDETLSILQQKNNGKISDMYDSMKEFFNSDTSSAKVMEAAVNQAQGAKSMEKAQKGELTKGEYIRENKARLKEMMKNRLYKKDKDGVDYIDKNRASLNMSRKDFEALMLATIERMTEDMDIKDVKEKMRQLPQTTEAGDRFLMDKVKENAVVLYGRSKQAGCSTIDSSMKYITNTKRPALPSPSDDKLMTFEEVFYYEQGINYSKEACEEYLNDKNELNMKLGAYNKSLQFKTESDNILKEKDVEKALNKLIELFENFYRNPIEPDLAFNNLQSIIQAKKLPIHLTQDENGKINMSVEIGSDDLLKNYVSDILSAESDIQNDRINKIFGGNAEEKISELQTKVEAAHEKAYGNDFSSTLGKMMMEDNKTFIQRYSGYASMTGMGLMLVGGVLCVTPAAGLGAGMVAVGQTLAMTGMASESVLGFAEAVTREHGAEDGEYEELTKNLIINAGGFIIGYRAGKAGDLAFQKLIGKKLSDVLKINITQNNRAAALKQVFSDKELLLNFVKAGVAKISSDFLISFTGDLVMMGVLDTEDDVLSLLKSNLMGIMVGTSGDIASTAKLGKKGKTYEALIKKEKEGNLSKQAADALNNLRQDPDIQRAYDIKTGNPKNFSNVDVNSKELKTVKEELKISEELSDASAHEVSATVDISKIQDIRKFGEIFNRMFVGKDITAKVLQDAGFSNEEIASLRGQYSKLDILTPVIRELINMNEISSKEEIMEFIEYNINNSEYLAMTPYINNKNIEWLMQAGNMDRGEALEVLSQIYGEKSLDINTFKDGIIRAQKENISFQEAIKKNHQEDQFLLEELTNEDYNKEIADEIINFQSKSEALDCEYDNVLSGLNENGFKMMKILMDASKKGDNEFIQNIHNIRMIVDDLQKYFSVDEVEQIINMKNDKGEPIINRNSYDKLARNKFDDINLPMTPEKLNNIKNQLRERFVNITDKDLASISSQIKDSKSATLISRLLSEKNQEDNKFLYDLDMIEAAAKYLNKYPDNKYIIEMIHNKTQNISDNKFFDMAYPEIIKMLENCKSDGDFIINELLKPKSENIHWRLIGFACHSINNCGNYRLAQDVAGDLLTRYWENDYNAGVLAKFTDEKSILLIQKMVDLREADKSQTYTNTDITRLMTKYQLSENKDIAEQLVKTIVENKLHINAFDTLLSAHNYDAENGTHCKDFAISILSIKDEQGVHKYSARTIEMILSNLPQPIKDKNLEYVKSVIIKYPTLTTKEILDIVKGRSVEIEPVYEYPFGENGIFAKEYSRITTTEAYKKLPQEIKSELFDYLNDLVKQDPNRFKRLVDSGYFELCSQGKLDINDLISNIGTRKFFSKNFLNDVKRMSSGEPLVKEYPSGTSLSKIASEVDIGEVASLDGKLYVNDNGKIVQLKITKEKFEELFPLESRFNSKQGSLGDCWLVSALDELMDVPNGRAKLYQLFEQNGNDITVTIPSKENVQITNELEDGTYEISWKEEFAEPYKITFKNGMPIKSKNGKQINGCKGFQLIEQAYSYNRAADFDKEITLDEMEVLFDVDQQMKHLAGGHSREFISSILEYRFEEPNLYDKNNELVGQGMEPSKNINATINLIKAVANSDNILLYASTLHKADNASRLEKDLAPSYDLYSNHAYSIKGFNEERGLVYFTNPWNTNTIVEMDVYTFLDYIDYVTYLKVN